MKERLVVVSNRIPTDAEPSGGLMVALDACLSNTGGLWVGCDPDPVDHAQDTLSPIGDGAYRRLTFTVTAEEHQNFYLGYCNSVLWPLFHRRRDLMANSAAHNTAYATVNARVARALTRALTPDDRIWVHDYHFLPLGAELRRLGVRNPIGFFLHTPFPLRADLPALPHHDDFLGWLAAYDLVGLQTERDVAACLEAFRVDPKTEVMRNGRLRRGERDMAIASFPIGIDAKGFSAEAQENADQDELALAPDQKLLIGVDRLDYSKGLVERFKGFEAFLDAMKPGDARATFLQIAQLSRADVEAYQNIRDELEATTGRINGRHGAFDWTPLRYLSQGIERERVAGLMRRADACLVTPLADGMNLVAKEYVAAQDHADPGVLILSHFAGASEQLVDALTVNPYETSEIARAIQTALTMPLDERKERHSRLRHNVETRDIAWWTDAFLSRLSKICTSRLPELRVPINTVS
ncbi:MAG: trehalose-6-phosphate synthase [Pseudomonadota bacterium]